MSAPITHSGIEEIRERIRRLEGAAARRRLVLPFGIKAIDRHLPGGGLAFGALHEVAGGGHGAIDGAAAALFAAGVAVHTRGTVLWCITRPDLFAPALAQGRGLGTSVGISPRLPTDESNSNDGSLASAK
jgi:protein ImuA